jgi:hypothetical protein
VQDRAPVRAQKEITLKNELELRDRLAIYQNYLLYCVSGEVLELPMGSSSTPLVAECSDVVRLASM